MILVALADTAVSMSRPSAARLGSFIVDFALSLSLSFSVKGCRRDLLVLRPRCALGSRDEPRAFFGVLPLDEAVRHEAHEAADERNPSAPGARAWVRPSSI